MREHRDKTGSVCPARDAVCTHCSRRGHFTCLCRSKGDGNPSASAAVGHLAQGAQSVPAVFAVQSCVPESLLKPAWPKCRTWNGTAVHLNVAILPQHHSYESRFILLRFYCLVGVHSVLLALEPKFSHNFAMVRSGYILVEEM